MKYNYKVKYFEDGDARDVGNFKSLELTYMYIKQFIENDLKIITYGIVYLDKTDDYIKFDLGTEEKVFEITREQVTEALEIKGE